MKSVINDCEGHTLRPSIKGYTPKALSIAIAMLSKLILYSTVSPSPFKILVNMEPSKPQQLSFILSIESSSNGATFSTTMVSFGRTQPKESITEMI